MGTGISQVYPKENAKLVERILDSGGAIVSQFPLETPPIPENFPYRNRVISGLSLGVLLVEASERSGSLITARLAMEQNREVFAVPGNITSKNSFGTNYLIKSGAKLVQQWQDVVHELPAEIAAQILPPVIEETTIAGEKQQSNHQKLIPADLSDNERKVYQLLSTDEAKHIDLVSEKSGLAVNVTMSILFALDMRDLIRELPGKHFVRKI
jgi:DNA processing protein